MINTIQVKTKKHIKLFNALPQKLYNSCDYFVSPYKRYIKNLFNTRKNTKLQANEIAGYLAYQDGKIVGRALGIINRIEGHQDKIARMAYVDFINDTEVSFALFECVEKWAKLQGANKIITPVGFDEFESIGLLTAGFDNLTTILENYNFPYYEDHFLAYNYKKERDIQEYCLSPKELDAIDVSNKNLKLLEKNSYKILDLSDKKICNNYTRKICDFLLECNLTGHSTCISEKSFRNFIKITSHLTDIGYSVIVVNEFDEVVGVLMLGTNASRSLQLSCGKILSEVSVGWQDNKQVLDIYSLVANMNDHVLDILFNHLYLVANKNKFDIIESNLNILSDELSNLAKKNFSLTKSKIRSIYFKNLL